MTALSHVAPPPAAKSVVASLGGRATDRQRPAPPPAALLTGRDAAAVLRARLARDRAALDQALGVVLDVADRYALSRQELDRLLAGILADKAQDAPRHFDVPMRCADVPVPQEVRP